MPESPDSARALLRHTVATVAYRASKTLREAPEDFATFHGWEGTRTPIAILAHLGDLFEWALSVAKGDEQWHETVPVSWTQEVDRFFTTLERFDEHIASGQPLASPPERLFQGPIADALTHIGQLAMLRRAAGRPLRGENYHRAEIVGGRVGRDQAVPRREFD